MDNQAFIARYEAILKERKIPKMQFYKDCEISDAAVSQWRKGKNNPSMTTIMRIAARLGVSEEYLLTGITKPTKEARPKEEKDELNGRREDYNKLTPDNRALFDSIVDNLLEKLIDSQVDS